MVVKRDDIVRWLKEVAQVLKANKEYLTDLDAAIGDADHGINMDRGFTAVLEKLATVEDKDIGTILKTVGMTLVSTVGGAGGPLYGTFFMKAGTVLVNKLELTNGDLVVMFESALEGVIQRGKANLGDKTMVDAITPAVAELKKATEEGLDTLIVLERTVDACEKGMIATIPMKALKGRASYLGDRSIGHQDPGATSSCLIFKTLWDILNH